MLRGTLFRRERKRKLERSNENPSIFERIDSSRRKRRKRRDKNIILEKIRLEIKVEKEEREREREKVTENYGLHGSFLLIASRNASTRRINWG